jgi:SAM-dependent methyltransferase
MSRSDVDELLRGFEELPYVSEPFHATHPDALATPAYLAGLDPAPVERCRVLEIGCGTGANLLPMALGLPGSRFVGIDLSPRQIEMGRAHAGAIGLVNLELAPRDLLSLDRGAGEFDYIICHGVYSWCPPAAQEKILAICDENLAPHGVAYISYNTFPGWHRRLVLRDLMLYQTAHLGAPAERVRAGRAAAEVVLEATGSSTAPHAASLKELIEGMRPQPDTYVFHELLEVVNEPVHFHEMVARASAHGLRWLGESLEESNMADLPPAVQQKLRALAGDEIRLEQLLDFVRGRTFRQSLWVHGSAPLERGRPLSVERARRLYLTTALRADSSAADLAAGARETFRGDGRRITTDMPLLKAILVSLADASPRRLSWAEVLGAARARLGVAAGDPDLTEDMFADLIGTMAGANLVSTHLFAPRVAVEPGPRPAASPLARRFARLDGPIPNLQHRGVTGLGPFERRLLELCDGTRDRAALAEALLAAAVLGDLPIERVGAPVRDAAELRRAIGELLAPTLVHLGRLAFFS